ncbi:11508_t:CDS:2 [Ambispora gerdemannii]|uniref:F-actin-capping protein subunit alpha n=1 Tax=Ambispora gerdemannii TaxID=144530 RepID=A0A9N8WR60_9GLOM|nr:11508_t:CDS:2 [Ambispora gerdemannii]
MEDDIILTKELPLEEKIKIVNGFLLDSPPGEITDVITDLQTLMSDDAAFEEGILSTLEEYNTEQYITVKLPEQKHEVIISKYGQLESDLFIDPKSRQIFRFNHLRPEATLVEALEPDEETEPLRAALETAVEGYVIDHYPKGVSAVYSKDQKLTIVIVDNKYNSDNFWQVIDSGEIKGNVKANVHYYEDGNVQLNCNKDFELTTNTNFDKHASAAAAYLKQIGKAENEFQASLIEAYADLSDNTFKSLRRALPLTRNKLDWDKISNYNIGQELSKEK